MKRAIVTGAAGFIGSNLTKELEIMGWDVLPIDNLSSGTKKNITNFEYLDITPGLNVSGKIDVIFHQAAQSDPRFESDAKTIFNNLKSFDSVFRLARKKKAKLIYASSASVYGNGPVPMKEDQTTDPLNVYAKTKEKIDKIAIQSKDMGIIGLRYFNVFGPNEKHKGRSASIIYHLINKMKEGHNPILFDKGEQKRDFVYVKDVVQANLNAIDAPNGIYNVGTGISTSFNRLVEMINQILHKNLKAEYTLNPYPSYQSNTQADTTKAETILNFKAKWELQEAIEDYWRVFK